MEHSIICNYRECLTDADGNLIVSFAVAKGAKQAALKCINDIVSRLVGTSKRLRIDISEDKSKRSRNANSYLWQLCDQIAEKIGSSKTDIYRSYIVEYGMYTEIEIQDNAVDLFAQLWGVSGIGWIVETVDKSARKGYVIIRVYKGSSTYDTAQMSKLIDRVVMDAKELDIETKTPAELAIMMQQWQAAEHTAKQKQGV